MNENNKNIIKNTGYLYLRSFLILLVSLYTSRLVLSALGVTDYGIYNVVGGLVSIFAFINGAMVASTLRFLTYELGKGNIKRLNNVFSSCLLLHIIISLGFFLSTETVGSYFFLHEMSIPKERLDAASFVFHLSILTSCVNIICVPYNALLIAHERMSSFAFISVLECLLKLLIAFFTLYYIGEKLEFYSTTMSFLSILILIIYFIFCKKNFIEASFKFTKDYNLLLILIKYAGWCLFSNLAFAFYTQGINVLLNVFFGPIVNASRGIAVQVFNAVCSFTNSFLNAINPQITKAVASNEKKRLEFLIDCSSRYSFFLVLIICYPLIFETPFFLKIWLVDYPDYTVVFIRYSLLTELISIMLNSLNIACQATGNIKRWAFITGFLQIFILPISYCALKIGSPPESVYIVHFFYSFIISFIYVYLTCYEIGVSALLFLKKIALKLYIIAIISAAPPILFRYLFQSDEYLISFLCFFITELSIVTTIFLLGISSSEKKIIFNFLRLFWVKYGRM